LSEGFRHITRNGKADADAAAAWRQNRGVDTNQLAVQVQQRAAGVTRLIEASVWIKFSSPSRFRPLRPSAETGCGGLPEAKRVTDGHGEIANAKFIGVGDGDLRQVAGVLHCSSAMSLWSSPPISLASNSRPSFSWTLILSAWLMT
jgi:hypothetical protein